MPTCPKCSKPVTSDAKRCLMCGFSLVATTTFLKKETPPLVVDHVVAEQVVRPSGFSPEILAHIIGIGSILFGTLAGAFGSLTFVGFMLAGGVILGGIGMLNHSKWGLMMARVATLFAIIFLGLMIFLMVRLPTPFLNFLTCFAAIAFACWAFYHMMFNKAFKELYD